jgi:hypothetical protein
MNDEHGRLLGRIETQIENLCERQDRHYEANKEDHQGIRDDLSAHNDRVLTCIATTTADKVSGDEEHSRLWSILYFVIGIAVAAIGALAGMHFSG